ncbi:MAG: MATE family efflux transporter [Proteobacteria bacterium]|nr:MATE family efflux transporter [Pseudomonadota bacterium]MBU1715618.1 MATE family efflux transporter [Pseudomonadota bacterium]
MSKHLDPVTGKVVPVFFGYAVPSIIGMLSLSCAVVVDGIFLGKYGGTTSLASVNLTIPATGLLFGVALMFSVGGAIRCGKHIGAGDLKAANGSFSQTIGFISLLSILLTALGLVFMDQLVFLLGADATLAPTVAEYLGVLLFFTIFQLGAVCLSYFVRVANLPIWAAAAMVIGSLLNILLDWIFVVKLQMGHQGAALGTGLAETTSFLLLCAPFLSKRAKLKFSWRKKDISEVFKAGINGFPEFFNEFSIGIIMFIFNWIIMKKLGANGIAAFSIINYMFMGGLVISYGISDSLQPVISQNYGALQPKRIRLFMIIATTTVFVVGIVISTLLATNPHVVSDLFIRAGERETIKLTNLFISRIWPVFIINGVNIVLAAYLMAMHRCLDSTLIILTRNLLLPVLFLFIIHVLIGHDAIMIVLPISELVTFFISVFLIYKYSPKKLIGKVPVLKVAVA